MNARERAERDADFTAFVEASGLRLTHLAELLTGDAHRAADLVQSTLERAYTRWHRIRADDPHAYVRRILITQHHNFWRSNRDRERPVAQVPDIPGAEDAAERQAQRALVRQALGRLTTRERTVVVLRFHLDLSEAAIAEQLGVALGTVKSTLSRALAKLRACPELSSPPNDLIEAHR